MNPLPDVHGPLLIVRPPVPATVNKAGANYKSEVAHLTYSPRRAYDEWLSILDAIVACGGDAVYQFEAVDDPFLGRGDLAVDAVGTITPVGSREALGNVADIMTGRVFAANGPWVVREDDTLRAVMPNMLAHRQPEAPYYRTLLGEIAGAAGWQLQIIDNPHRWEGMADVAVVGDRVVFTYAVSGHYDRDSGPKSSRSSRQGAVFAADVVGVPGEARIFVELVYPHFHGDTVHFCARPIGLAARTSEVLVHYRGGLYGNGADIVGAQLGGDSIVAIGAEDAVEHYAANSRQVEDGLLVPEGVSREFTSAMARLGLSIHSVSLSELFGKAGGGPACATLYLPRNAFVPTQSPLRYSATRDRVWARRDRIPHAIRVDPGYWEGKPRG